jgi:hypothetical protein
MNINNVIIANNPIKITKIINFIFCSELSGVLVVVGRVDDPVRGRSNQKNE